MIQRWVKAAEGCIWLTNIVNPSGIVVKLFIFAHACNPDRGDSGSRQSTRRMTRYLHPQAVCLRRPALSSDAPRDCDAHTFSALAPLVLATYVTRSDRP